MRYELFCNQLILFTKVINQTSNVIKKKSTNLAAALIVNCQVLMGNPSDTSLFQGVVNRVVDTYGITPRDSATD